MLAYDSNTAIAHLQSRDETLGRLIAKVGAFELSDEAIIERLVDVRGVRRTLPTPEQLQRHGERWRPYRSVACWYMWRATELDPGDI